MKKINILFITLLLTVVQQCTGSNVQENLVHESVAQIKGVIKDSSVSRVSIMYPGLFLNSEFNNLGFTQISNGNLCLEEVSINTPVQAFIGAVNHTTQPIFITPGDSVEFVTVPLEYLGRKHVAFEFTGKNSAHYNYEYLWKKFLNSEEYILSPHEKSDDLMKYREGLNNLRLTELAFLENYKLEYEISEEFYLYQKAGINNYFIYKLLLPVKQNYIKKENLPAGYLDVGFDPDINGHSYALAMIYKYIDGAAEKKLGDFDKDYASVVSRFEGQPREFLLSALIGLYASNKREQSDKVLAAAEQIGQYVKDPYYLDYIGRAVEFLRITYDYLPEEVLTGTILKPYGEDKTLTLREVLERYKGKAVYLDFWASWCGPCRDDISNSAEAKEYLAGSGVEYVYFADGDSERAWNAASQKDGITANQYFLVGNSHPLREYFRIAAIPRYVLLDKSHRVYEQKAPRPTESELDELKKIIEKIETGIPNYY